jgi:hypothetical protein
LWLAYSLFGVHDPFGAATAVIFSLGYVGYLSGRGNARAVTQEGAVMVRARLKRYEGHGLGRVGLDYVGYGLAVVLILMAGVVLLSHAYGG